MIQRMKTTKVIFFSRDGSSTIAAEYIAEKLQADTLELRPAKALKGFLRLGMKSIAGKHIELEGNPWAEIADYQRLIIGGPIWAGNGNPVLRSFIQSADLNGKTIYLFTLQADPSRSSAESALSSLNELIKKHGGIVAGVQSFHGAPPGKRAESEYLQQQLDDWDLLNS